MESSVGEEFPYEAARRRVADDGRAPVLEPGLDSFAWPLSRSQFMESMWKRRAFAVHGCADRAQRVVRDFYAGDVASLIAHASNTVVWMQSLEGQMQHFYADAAFAAQAYAAGHTLYFNHPRDLQRRYIKRVCEELGLDFGLELDGGFGGDVEVFACAGRHMTDWHLDAQENFTVQLRGTKRWTIMPGVTSPVTNCITPTNTYRDGYSVQKMCHRYYAEPGLNLPPIDFSLARTVHLRPGSVLYVPAGWWHRVECDCDEGSLSINYSLNSRSALDVMQDHLTALLWRSRDWRDNIVVRSPADCRERLAALLRGLGDVLTQLTPERMLPDAAFRSLRAKRIDVRVRGAFPRPEGLAPATILAKSPLSVLVLMHVEEQEWAGQQRELRGDDAAEVALLDCSNLQSLQGEGFSRKRPRSDVEGAVTAVSAGADMLEYRVHSGFGNPNFVPLVTVTVTVPAAFRPGMAQLELRALEDHSVTLSKLRSWFQLAEDSEKHDTVGELVAALLHAGYLEVRSK